jgi:protein dithiol oxidoreductase (disulfide-forming)
MRIPGGNATVGTISGAGVYKAPTMIPSPATAMVTAVSTYDPTRSASAAVAIANVVVSVTTSSARRRRRMRGSVVLAMTLALLGASGGAHADSRWVVGQHYFLINPAQPTGLPAGKVQVIEIFSYACPGCNRFYPVADRLRAALPPYAVMEYLPASFRPDEDWPMFQRAYVTAQQMGIDERTHDAMFDAVWKSGELAVFDPATQHARHPAPSITDAAQFYARAAGVKPEAFLATAGSFAVDLKVREADERIRNYGIGETPSIVVNGKYRLNPVSAGGYEETIELVKWLVSQEARRQ